jgi:predicted nucleic acid-binding protein
VGAEKVNASVTDAGPLIHLTEVGCLHFLKIFDALHIPDAVWSETVEQNRIPQGNILALGNIQRLTVSQSEVIRFTQENRFENLHNGERECLYLCQKIGVLILLTDDLIVREAAQHLNITPIGSLGVLVKAYHLGHIVLADVERYITDLYDVSSLFVTRTIIELVIESLHQTSNKSNKTLK